MKSLRFMACQVAETVEFVIPQASDLWFIKSHGAHQQAALTVEPADVSFVVHLHAAAIRDFFRVRHWVVVFSGVTAGTRIR